MGVLDSLTHTDVRVPGGMRVKAVPCRFTVSGSGLVITPLPGSSYDGELKMTRISSGTYELTIGAYRNLLYAQAVYRTGSASAIASGISQQPSAGTVRFGFSGDLPDSTLDVVVLVDHGDYC